MSVYTLKCFQGSINLSDYIGWESSFNLDRESHTLALVFKYDMLMIIMLMIMMMTMIIMVIIIKKTMMTIMLIALQGDGGDPGFGC